MARAGGADGGAGGGAGRRARRSPRGALGDRAIVGRVVLTVLGLLVVGWAVQGGEYGTTDLLRQRREIAREQAAVDSLARVVDTLQTRRKLIETDPATQERIAREEFGMVRGEREILYRFYDTAPAGTAR